MSNEELAALIQQGQRQYIPQLYKQVERLLRIMATRYYNRFCSLCTRCGLTDDDLIQEGFFVMLDAVKSYRADRKIKFVTYLRFPFINRVHQLTGWHRGKRNPLNDAESLDEPLTANSDGLTRGDTIKDDNVDAQFDKVEDVSYLSALHEAFRKSMADMDPQQRTVVHYRYFENMTLQAIGDKVSCTREQVRQLDAKAIRYLRRPKISSTLRPFLYDEMESEAFRGTGLNAFRNKNMSSVERTAERMEDLKKRVNETKRLVEEYLAQ